MNIIRPDGGYTTYPTSRTFVPESDGRFEVYVVPSHAYVLRARGSDGYSDEERLDVGQEDLEGVVMTLKEPVRVRGFVVPDGPWPPGFDVLDLRVRMRVSEVGLPPSRRFEFVSADGSIDFWQQQGIKTSVDLEGLPDGAYLESAHYGAADVLADGFTPTNEPGRQLVLRVAFGTGEVRGTVLDLQGRPRPDALVSLVPDGSHGPRQDLQREAASGRDGTFSFEGVPPGSYRVFAWERVPAGAHRNEAFRLPYLLRGVFVVVAENGSVETELRLIPAVF